MSFKVGDKVRFKYHPKSNGTIESLCKCNPGCAAMYVRFGLELLVLTPDQLDFDFTPNPGVNCVF